MSRDVVDTRGLARAAGSASIGRYFKLKGWTCWLGVHWHLWATQEQQSPLWLFIMDSRAEGNAEIAEAVRTLQARGVMANDSNRQMCISLPTSKDRDAVLASIMEQITAVAQLLPDARTVADSADPRQGKTAEATDPDLLPRTD